MILNLSSSRKLKRRLENPNPDLLVVVNGWKVLLSLLQMTAEICPSKDKLKFEFPAYFTPAGKYQACESISNFPAEISPSKDKVKFEFPAI